MIRGEDYAHFWVEEGILHFVYKPNSLIDVEAARAVVRDRLRFQNGVSYPILCDIRLLKTANKAAREYLAEQGCINALAVALLIEKEYSGTLSQAFIKISNPTVPTREFTTETDALDFLHNFR
ncbi:hypothetical protein FK178_08605 [Antarcticibacterium arcticum]|uniref:DUF7793 domain-containing protein n=1 Tax=Antarcticibacterium arcticum TaxID=2585771 RepID=A0A5B8YIK7_9FLAO|nr:hypothetical protein [Antarcticibacterium arcticum]QED37780.1 hypothetical protein FK178_08605 [Antarcticibacterium arcticum]